MSFIVILIVFVYEYWYEFYYHINRILCMSIGMSVNIILIVFV